MGARLQRTDTPTTASSVSSVAPCPDLDISGLLPASMKLWCAFLLARKQGTIQDPLQFFNATSYIAYFLILIN